MNSLSVAARRHIGLRYITRGDQPGIGLCCYGLVRAAAAELGYELPDWRIARRILQQGPESIERQLPVRRVDKLCSDIIALMSNGCGLLNARAVHLGIVGRQRHRLTMIHTSNHLGRVVEEPVLATAYEPTATFWELS